MARQSSRCRDNAHRTVDSDTRVHKKAVPMQFSTGQIVVHPHHGPATVTEIFDRTIKTTRLSYLRLAIHRSDLTIDVPVAKAEELGLREIYDTTELKDLFEVLHAPTPPEDNGWSRRFKDHQDKLRLGDLLVTAGVVRDLTRREHRCGLSLGEKKMLRSARNGVLAELCLALSIPDEQAETLLDSAILAPRPALEQQALAAAG